MEVVIKEEGITLFKSDVTNKEVINIINSLKLRDKTIERLKEKEEEQRNVCGD